MEQMQWGKSRPGMMSASGMGTFLFVKMVTCVFAL